MQKIIIIRGESDWNIDFFLGALVVPEWMDIEAEKKELLSMFPPNQCTTSLKDWLLSRGARIASPDEAEEVEGW